MPDAKVACPGWMSPFFLRNSMMIGIEPKISMTENKINEEDTISLNRPLKMVSGANLKIWVTRLTQPMMMCFL